jgi:hypothetical protein
MDLYIHSPIRLHGVVLTSLSTGTTLPLPHLYHTDITVVENFEVGSTRATLHTTLNLGLPKMSLKTVIFL